MQKQQKKFLYEKISTNPITWPCILKKRIKLHLIYLCLNSIDEAKRRVAIRVQNGGHFVSEDEIQKRYFEGFANLNEYFTCFDIVDVFDTSAYAKQPEYIFSVENGKIAAEKSLPQYIVTLIPAITKL